MITKLIITSVCAVMLAMPAAYAADGVAARMSCAEITAEINRLAAIAEPTESESTRLKEMRVQNRRMCVKSAAGRGAQSQRAVKNTPGATTAAEQIALDTAKNGPKQDAMETFLNAKAENCKALQSQIDEMKSAETPDDEKIAAMQAQYDADCVEKPAEPEPVDEPEIDPVAEAERINALIDAGLCADGTKPNKYGCCTGETFKDLGNLVFACCPADGGECFPPMNNGSAL